MSTQPQHDADVIVVEAGNAALVAALAALERAARELAGGTRYYTAGRGASRTGGPGDLLDLVEPHKRHNQSVVPAIPVDEYVEGLNRVTNSRADSDMVRTVATEVVVTLRWLVSRHRLSYRLMYERQTYKTDEGTWPFWGRLHVGNVDRGVGLLNDELAAVAGAGGEIRYGQHVAHLLFEGGAAVGVEIEAAGGRSALQAESVILAGGGFEVNADLRREYLADGWEHAKLLGTTPYNTGGVLVRALELGAAPGGDWSTCHSVAWDARAKDDESNRELTNRLTRQSYILGIVVNRDGERVLDERVDFRNCTYAKYGAEILKQPGSIVFQIFDARLRLMLRSQEYDMGIGFVEADTIEALAVGTGVEEDRLRATIDGFNASVDRSLEPTPSIKDDRSASVHPPKNNWAYPIETPRSMRTPSRAGSPSPPEGSRATLMGVCATTPVSRSPASAPVEGRSAGCSAGTTPEAVGWPLTRSSDVARERSPELWHAVRPGIGRPVSLGLRHDRRRSRQGDYRLCERIVMGTTAQVHGDGAGMEDSLARPGHRSRRVSTRRGGRTSRRRDGDPFHPWLARSQRGIAVDSAAVGDAYRSQKPRVRRDLLNEE